MNLMEQDILVYSVQYSLKTSLVHIWFYAWTEKYIAGLV